MGTPKTRLPSRFSVAVSDEKGFRSISSWPLAPLSCATVKGVCWWLLSRVRGSKGRGIAWVAGIRPSRTASRFSTWAGIERGHSLA